MSIKSSALAVTCKTVLFIIWKVEMESGRFLVYQKKLHNKRLYKTLTPGPEEYGSACYAIMSAQ